LACKALLPMAKLVIKEGMEWVRVTRDIAAADTGAGGSPENSATGPGAAFRASSALLRSARRSGPNRDDSDIESLGGRSDYTYNGDQDDDPDYASGDDDDHDASSVMSADA